MDEGSQFVTLPDRRRTFGEEMEMVEKAERERTKGAIAGNKGRKMYAKIIAFSSDYVDDLMDEIVKHSIPDKILIWAKGNTHYAMLFYHNWEEPE
ncbi:hypothetical protein LCGC14_1787420 [marine sediment metagenome]|uniref:Uncharacterized protein n=1 Tax=marine sediment metagenome TaxID=412755 RepID=A0A0F9JT83_9ZZZZ